MKTFVVATERSRAKYGGESEGLFRVRFEHDQATVVGDLLLDPQRPTTCPGTLLLKFPKLVGPKTTARFRTALGIASPHAIRIHSRELSLPDAKGRRGWVASVEVHGKRLKVKATVTALTFDGSSLRLAARYCVPIEAFLVDQRFGIMLEHSEVRFDLALALTCHET